MDKKWEDEEILSAPVLDFFRSADHICLNVEGAICDICDSSSCGAFFHAMNPDVTGFLINLVLIYGVLETIILQMQVWME